MTDVTPEEQERADIFYQQLGRAVTRWITVEYALENLFLLLTGLPEKAGRRLFNSARSFQGRYDMLASLLGVARSRPGYVAALRVVLAKAKDYSIFRNFIVHERISWRHDPTNPGRGNLVIYNSGTVPALDGSDFQQIEANDLVIAGENFRLLARLIGLGYKWDGDDQTGSPERLTWLAGQLPSPPYSQRLDPSVSAQFGLGLPLVQYPE